MLKMKAQHVAEPIDRRSFRGVLLAITELLIMVAVIYADVLIPSLIVVAAGVLFTLLRREKPPITRPPQGFTAAGFVLRMLGWAVVWTAVEYALILPVQNHLLGDTRNVDSFAAVQGDLVNLLLFLLLSWTVAAVGEELAFRGFFQNRIISLFRGRTPGIVVAVTLTSLLFGFMHREQGVVGVAVTAIDSVFFSVIRYRYESVWASVLVHGFLNSIGLIAFYFAGPLYGLW